METFLTTPWKELAEATTKEATDDLMDTIPVLSTLKNPDDAIGAENDAPSDGLTRQQRTHMLPSSCKFTLFVAQGREDNFFRPNFKGPKGETPSDQFSAHGGIVE
jgi:hypothetical protein